MIDHVWGIDVSTLQTDVATVRRDGRWETHVWDWPKSPGAERLDWIRRSVVLAADRLALEYPPMAVFIEQPMGRHPSPPLVMAAGAVAGAVYGALRDVYAHPVMVEFANISDWKKEAVGHSNASKEQVLRWARSLGYTGLEQDPADALGVACFAARNVGCGPGPLALRSEAA